MCDMCIFSLVSSNRIQGKSLGFLDGPCYRQRRRTLGPRSCVGFLHGCALLPRPLGPSEKCGQMGFSSRRFQGTHWQTEPRGGGRSSPGGRANTSTHCCPSIPPSSPASFTLGCTEIGSQPWEQSKREAVRCCCTCSRKKRVSWGRDWSGKGAGNEACVWVAWRRMFSLD